MKDIKHNRWDFHSATCVMPQRLDLWVLMGDGQVNFFFRNSTKNGTCNGTIFWELPAPLEPWGGAKRSNIITKSISKIIKPNFVCLLTNGRYKTYQTGFLFDRLGHALGVGLGGTLGGLGASTFF